MLVPHAKVYEGFAVGEGPAKLLGDQTTDELVNEKLQYFPAGKIPQPCAAPGSRKCVARDIVSKDGRFCIQLQYIAQKDMANINM